VRKTQQAPNAFLKMKNPLPASPENVFSGQTFFHFDAETGPIGLCHGISGNGLVILFRQLAPSPRNFTCSQTIDPLPDGQLFWITKNGSPGTAMPAFKNLDPGKAQVAELMSFPLIKLESQESMDKALQVMRDQAIHHLAVTEHGQILGILSINDYHKYLVLKHPK
jgi:hypothetical protein